MLALQLPAYPAKIIEKEGKRMIYDSLRKKYVTLTPEEWVRQHFVHYLIETKGYPQNLLANEVMIRLNQTAKRCDTVAYDKYLHPLAIIEYKAPHITIDNCVFEQIVRYNQALHVPYLIISNGLQHYACRIQYNEQSYCFLKEIPTYKDITDP